MRTIIDPAHLKFLGRKVRDKVTGVEGVVTSVGFDLFGCVQSVVQPFAKDGAVPDSRWFDNNRLELLEATPVMNIPNFAIELKDRDEKGPANKPSFASMPLR